MPGFSLVVPWLPEVTECHVIPKGVSLGVRMRNHKFSSEVTFSNITSKGAEYTSGQVQWSDTLQILMCSSLYTTTV
jgi:hypothetical protein